MIDLIEQGLKILVDLRRPVSHKALNKAIKNCKRAMISVQPVRGASAIGEELRDFVSRSEKKLREAPSTGDKASRIRRELAVDMTIYIMVNMYRMPTVSSVAEAAAKLVFAMTGREPSNMLKYASTALKRMEASGFPDAKARERLDRDGEIAVCEKMKKTEQFSLPPSWPSP